MNASRSENMSVEPDVGGGWIEIDPCGSTLSFCCWKTFVHVKLIEIGATLLLQPSKNVMNRGSLAGKWL